MTLKWQISSSPVPYLKAVEAMETQVEAIREKGAEEMIWLLEHPCVYTAGTSATPQGLLDAQRFPVFKTGRGGDYTYHGPGQRIAYVMIDLQARGGDLHGYVHDLESWIIAILERFDIAGERRSGRVGIWVVDKSGNEKKIAALGVRVRRGVTYHGVSINLSPDLSHYDGIIPCGISEYGVTSLSDFGSAPTMEELDQAFKDEFPRIF